jgi:hypothetical protein
MRGDKYPHGQGLYFSSKPVFPPRFKWDHRGGKHKFEGPPQQDGGRRIQDKALYLVGLDGFAQAVWESHFRKNESGANHIAAECKVGRR